MISRIRRMAPLALLVALVARGGPLGFEDMELARSQEVVVNCGACTFVTSFEHVPAASDWRDTIYIIMFMAGLGLIGLVGVYFRVRVKR